MLELTALAVLTAAWLVPNHYPPWSSFYNESAAALGLALLAASVGRRWVKSRIGSTAGVVALIALIPAAQWLGGRIDFFGDALISSLYIFGFAAAIAVGEMWAQTNARLAATRLSAALVIGSVISANLAMIQTLDPFNLGLYGLDTFRGMRAYANLGQPNNLATLIAMGSVGLLVLYEARRLGPLTSAVLAFVLLLGISLTQSRMALLFGPLFLAFMLVAKSRGLHLRTPVSAIAIATGSHWAMTFNWPLLQKALMLLPTATLAERGIESVRLQMWPMLLDAATQRPWAGYGWLHVGEAELAVADAYPPVGELWLHGHNLFVELIVWSGFPIGIALSGLAIYWFASRLIAIDSLESAAGMLVVAVVGTHALLELPYHYAYFLIPVGLWVGQVENRRAASRRIEARWLLPPTVLAAVLLLGIWRDYPAVEDDFRLVRFENLRIGTLRSTALAPEAPLLTGLTEFLGFTRTLPAAGMSQAALDRMSAVVRRTPYSAAMLRYAIALSLNGRLAEARTLMVKARHIHGEANYAALRRDLRDRIQEGQSLLVGLYAVMPE